MYTQEKLSKHTHWMPAIVTLDAILILPCVSTFFSVSRSVCLFLCLVWCPRPFMCQACKTSPGFDTFVCFIKVCVCVCVRVCLFVCA
ncbi:unnamed protein product [Arctogadus glacialis]